MSADASFSHFKREFCQLAAGTIGVSVTLPIYWLLITLTRPKFSSSWPETVALRPFCTLLSSVTIYRSFRSAAIYPQHMLPIWDGWHVSVWPNFKKRLLLRRAAADWAHFKYEWGHQLGIQKNQNDCKTCAKASELRFLHMVQTAKLSHKWYFGGSDARSREPLFPS